MPKVKSTPLYHFFNPRFWGLWFALGGLWLTIHLPVSIQLRIGLNLGHILKKFSKHRRKIALINIQKCFPDLSQKEQDELLNKHFEALGMYFVETALCWWAPAKKLEGRYTIKGMEHLEKAFNDGKGVILLSAHFTSFEIGCRLLSAASKSTFHGLYRQHKNPLLEEMILRGREAHFEKIIPREDIRGMLRSLKKNNVIWYAPDQDYGRHHSVFVPFFGIPAATITATSRLAKMSGAAVIPFFPHRLPDQQGYSLELLPPLENFPGDSDEQDATRINQLIETAINKTPEQYLWVHRRFKTRPEGEASFYK
ncbi:MAG TPA: LpxL/LpxP family Kdo(2)-lipid IV(A) lauroyl/palmitoleoyl acyltransferase [Gammaproteobacteria bacterium]|nr:LpxL/LpxP family Kdo(2)-lipid IV(A) lauroyl/palmitoleoyl acyltransferase [Gammaproteobacteria bacterium]